MQLLIYLIKTHYKIISMNDNLGKNFKELDFSKIIEVELKKIPDGIHLSAQELHQHLLNLGYAVSLSSVYRVLAKLKSDGDLSSIRSDKQQKYEFKDGLHDHLICLHCGITIEFTDDFINGLGQTLAKRKGYSYLNSRFDIFGFCDICQKSSINDDLQDLSPDIVEIKARFKDLLALIELCQEQITQANPTDCLKTLTQIQQLSVKNQESLNFIIDSFDKII